MLENNKVTDCQFKSQNTLLEQAKRLNIINKQNTNTNIKYRILSSNFNDENKALLYKKYKELKDDDEHDYLKTKKWINTALKIPTKSYNMGEFINTNDGYKIVNSDKLKKFLNYNFIYPDPLLMI